MVLPTPEVIVRVVRSRVLRDLAGKPPGSPISLYKVDRLTYFHGDFSCGNRRRTSSQSPYLGGIVIMMLAACSGGAIA